MAMSFKRKNLFSLIEILAVIVVVSLLLGIVFVGVNDVKNDAHVSALSSNIKTIQTAIDKYAIKHYGKYPVDGEIDLYTPQEINLDILFPEDIRSVPDLKGITYWLDYTGKVWASSTNLPSNLEYTETDFKWSASQKAIRYKIYEISDAAYISGSVRNSKVKYNFAKELGGDITSLTRDGNKTYLVSAVDKNGFETPPVGLKPQNPSVNGNEKPISIINLTPSTNITTDTIISWNSNASYDPDGDVITNEEWENKQSNYSNSGEYTIRLRVQDEHGLWSDWLEQKIVVSRANQRPTAKINMSPKDELTEKSVIQWDSIDSSDPDGDSIVDEEWKNRFTSYPVGSYITELRVQDERGLWSDWASKVFTVNQSNRKPQAVISLTPNSNLTTDSSITWSSVNSTDIDGDAIVAEEWRNKSVTYVEGTHIVELRVQDERGLWSDWITKTISVNQPNVKPIAIISANPSPVDTRVDEHDLVTFSSSSSYDPNGDTITNKEWKLNGDSTDEIPSQLLAGDYSIELRVQDEHGLWSDWKSFDFTIDNNNKPVAVVDTTPVLTDGEIYPDTVISFNSDNSYDIDGDEIENQLWHYNGETYVDPSALPTVYPIGDHEVGLTVLDEHGLSSDKVVKTFTVVRKNNAPVPIIVMSASGQLTELTEVLFDSNSSYDPDGDLITSEEWYLENSNTIVSKDELPKKWSIGTHTVGLRVADREGKWSDWTSQTFEVKEYNSPPEAIISMSPEFNLTSSTAIVWNVDIFDEDGDTLQNVEWSNKRTYYPEGTHTVSVRVQDSRGLWGLYTNVEFQVVDQNSPPLAAITMTPVNPIVGNTITWSSEGSTDPDSDKIVKEDWIGNETTYAAPGEYSTYLRVQDEHGEWSDFTGKTFMVLSPPDASNRKPVAVISSEVDGVLSNFPVSPTSIHTYNIVTWKHDKSTDPDSDKIIKAQWMGDNNSFTSSGSYTIQLRVMDEHGLWSDWISRTFTVNTVKNNEKSPYDNNGAPIAVISINPDPVGNSTTVTKNTKYEFDHSKSVDPNGDKIVKAEWLNKKTKYKEGTHTVSLRVMDSKGKWSNWTSKTFSIGNKKPVAIINMNPDTFIDADQDIDLDDGLSYDPDGDLIVQRTWAGKTKNYPDGHTYRIKLRVKDSSGEKSDWACKKVVSGNGGPQVGKYTECDSTSDGTGYKLTPPKEFENKYYSKYFKNCPQEDKLTKPCGVVILSYQSPNGNIYTDTELKWSTFRTYDPTGSSIGSRLFTLKDGSTLEDDAFIATHKTLAAGTHSFSYQAFRESDSSVSSDKVNIEIQVIDNESNTGKTDSSGNKFGHVLTSEKCIPSSGNPDIKNCNVITVRYNSVDGKIYPNTELHWTTEDSYSTDGQKSPLTTDWYEGCPSDELECISTPEDIKFFATTGMKNVYTKQTWSNGQTIWNTLSFEVVNASEFVKGLHQKFLLARGKTHTYNTCLYQGNIDKPCAILTVITNTTDYYDENTIFKWFTTDSYSPKGHSISNVELINANTTYPNNTSHTITFRVQDEVGVWSDLISLHLIGPSFIDPCSDPTVVCQM